MTDTEYIYLDILFLRNELVFPSYELSPQSNSPSHILNILFDLYPFSEEFLDLINSNRAIVVTGETGCGKSELSKISQHHFSYLFILFGVPHFLSSYLDVIYLLNLRLCIRRLPVLLYHLSIALSLAVRLIAAFY